MKEINLYPHQAKAYKEIGNGKILTGGVGSGKSITSLAYFFVHECDGGLRINGQGNFKTPRRPVDIYVITTAKKRDDLDWEEEASRFEITTDRSTSVAGIQLKVDSWNNIIKYVDVKDAFFILDEQRLVGAGAWVKAFIKIAKNNRWIMLSATPGDTWIDYYPVFQANGFYKNKTDFQDQHVVWSRFAKFPKIERYVSEGKLNRLRKSILVEMPLKRHTTRHISQIFTDHDLNLYEKVVKKRWNFIEQRPIRDVAELFRLMRLIVNSDQSRLVQLLELWKKHPRLIVFYNFNYELESIRSTLKALGSTQTIDSDSISTGIEFLMKSQSSLNATSSAGKNVLLPPGTVTGKLQEKLDTERREILNGFLDKGKLNSTVSELHGLGPFEQAEWNGQKHESVPTSDRWIYLVQYTAGAEGWNCITTDAMVFYSLNYSYKIFEQSQGRIDRINTKFTDLYYYVLRSRATIDLAILKALKGKKSFNEKAYSKSFEEGKKE